MSQATISIYMQYPGIQGNVTALGYEKNIQLLSLHFSLQRNLHVQPGHVIDRGCSRPVVSEVTVTKRVDCASPLLLAKSAKTQVGESQPVIIEFVKTGDMLDSYQSIVLDDVMVSHYEQYYSVDHVSEWGVMRFPMETIKLNFTRIELTEIPSVSDGSADTQISASYDVALGR